MEGVGRSDPSVPTGDESSHLKKEAPPRRVFLRASEVPGLLLGVCRAEPVAQRRVLGARRGGRIGLFLGLVALALAVPDWSTAGGLALLHLVSTFGLGRVGGLSPLGELQRLRLSLWTGAAPLLLAAALRLIWAESLVPALAGLVAGQLLLYRALRRGLGAARRGLGASRRGL